MLLSTSFFRQLNVLSNKQYSRRSCDSFTSKAVPLQRQMNPLPTALQVSPSRQPNLCHQFRDQNGTRNFISSSPTSRRTNGGIRNADGLRGRHVILVRWFVTFGIHHLRALSVPTKKAGDSLSSPAALGRTKPDGRMDVNGAVRTQERGGQRTERRLFREIRSTESERESTVDRVGKERASERASARRKAGPTER